MKLAATAVMLAFVAVPALAQQYPAAGNSSAANPSAMDQVNPSASTSSSSDARVASNRHHKKQQSSESTTSQGQMSGSQGMSNQESPGAGQASPTPTQQQ